MNGSSNQSLNKVGSYCPHLYICHQNGGSITFTYFQIFTFTLSLLHFHTQWKSLTFILSHLHTFTFSLSHLHTLTFIHLLSLSNFSFQPFTFTLSHIHFKPFTFSLSHFYFHTITHSLSYFHFHTCKLSLSYLHFQTFKLLLSQWKCLKTWETTKSLDGNSINSNMAKMAIMPSDYLQQI